MDCLVFSLFSFLADAKVIADTRLPGVLCCQKLMYHFGVIFDVRSIFSQMEMCCERHWVAFFSKKMVVRWATFGFLLVEEDR